MPFLWFLITGCGGFPQNELSKTPLLVATKESVVTTSITLTPSLSTITQIFCQDSYYYSKQIEALQIWWQSDSQALLFVNRTEETRIFDYAHNKIIQDQSLSNPIGKIPDQIRKNIPSKIEDKHIHLSPTSGKAIYWVPHYTDPTPTPQTSGEPSGEPEIIGDLFWLDENNTEPEYLGRIENFIHIILWSQDEELILLGTGTSLYNTSILLVDLEKDIIKKLTFEKANINTKGLFPIGFTPENQSLLFRIKSEIYLKNIQTGLEEKLEIPLFRYHWWISELSFLAIIDDDPLKPNNSGIYVYDLENKNLSKISNTSIQSDASFIPNSIQLSPDKTKIGYIDRDYHLNVIQLCPEFLVNKVK